VGGREDEKNKKLTCGPHGGIEYDIEDE
jgi:hypothetical protein